MRERMRGAAADAAVAGGLALLAVALLWSSIRPGRTLVPADILAAFTPYSIRMGGFHPHNPVLSDSAIQFFPWFHYLGEALRAGRIPGWNPYLLGGLPMTPNGFVSTWYPGFFLVRWLDPFAAYNVFVVAHLWWAALGTYVFARVLGVRRVPAVIVAALALLAGTWVHWSLHLVHLVGMVWVPWMLALTHLVVRRPTPGRVAVLAAGFGVWWLGANPQYAYLGSIAMGVYALVRIVQGRRGAVGVVRPAAAFAGAIVLGALLAAPVLVPSARIGSTILRDREPVSATASNHAQRGELARMVVPDAWGNAADGFTFRTNTEGMMDSPFFGFTAVLLAGAGVAAGRGRSRWALLGIGVGVLVLAATGLPHHVLYRVVPGYNRFRVASRWFSVLPAVALPLAALGLDALLRRDRRARLGVLVVAVVSALAILWWWLWQNGASDAPHDYFAVRAWVALALLAAVVAAAFLAMRWPVVAAVAIAGCVVFELVFVTPRWYPSIEKRSAYPSVEVARVAAERGGRVMRGGRAWAMVSTFSSDVPMAYGVADAQGQTVMFPKDYDRYLRVIEQHGTFSKQTNVAPDVVRTSRLASGLVDVLDARTILAESNVPIPRSLPVLRSTGEPRIYANPDARPAMIVRRASPATSEEMWRAIARRGWDPARTSAVVGLDRAVEGAGGTVESHETGVDLDRWRVQAPRGGLLRVSARYAPGWTATIDGAPTPVYRADGIFRAVVVPSGSHTVTFRYRNPDEHTGMWLALVGVAGLVALGATGAMMRRRTSRDGGEG